MESRVMKILVLDDSELNCQSAMEQFRGHDLIIAKTYEDAQNHLSPTIDEVGARNIYRDISGKDYGEYEPNNLKEKTKMYDTYAEARRKSTRYPHFDVILLDLMIPAPRLTHGHENLVGQEMPLGIFIAFHALMCGAGVIGIITDLNHHKHPASACFDAFNELYGYPIIIEIGDSKICLGNETFVDRFSENNLACPLERWGKDQPGVKIVEAKNWLKFLNYINTRIRAD